MIEQLHLLILAIILFGVGLYAILGKRNVIKILMGIEIMTISINVAFIALGTEIIANGSNEFADFAQIFPLISLAVGAAVIALGLAIVINNYRHTKGVDSDEMSTLKR
ncbi:MAG: NADH-quinone oxidoreductase subunit NuoK [Candidatus Heimdallarchaeota archaeon]|nr:NADH-quinone oxidoreductase subunit NuoK [Candidatus Heimdallarchaeota archaeon]